MSSEADDSRQSTPKPAAWLEPAGPDQTRLETAGADGQENAHGGEADRGVSNGAPANSKGKDSSGKDSAGLNGAVKDRAGEEAEAEETPGDEALEEGGKAEEAENREREEGLNVEPVAPGDIVGEHYQIETKLGEGGMSTVYRARHLLLNKPVALKVLNETRSSDPKAVQRFQQEAKVISQVDHPNIVRLHEFGIDSQDRPYLVMDLVEGESLEQLIARKGKLGLKEALEIAVDVAEALQHAHEKGVVHRDLKPSNIVLEKTSSGRVRGKVVDFGIAKLASTTASQKLTQTGDTFGSPTYMSPEQCMGKEIGPRSDIYSLACVIVEMVAGKPLFEADMPIQVLAKHLNEKPLRLSHMKALQADRKHWTRQQATMMAALDRVLAKALSKNADDRYRSAAEFAQDLLVVITDPGSLAKNVPLEISHLERKGIFGQTSYLVIGILAAGLIYLVAASIYRADTILNFLTPKVQPAAQVEPPEPTYQLPPTPILQPTTFKQAAIMFEPDFVFDGLPAMHAYADALKSYTAALQEQQLKGWATSQDQLQLARDSLNLGRIMVDSDNEKAAINEFSRVIGLQSYKAEKPTNFSLDSGLLQSAYLGLGDARLAMGNFAEAIEAYQKAKEFYTSGDVFDDKLKQGLLMYRIGLCHTALADAASAKAAAECWKQALELLQMKDPQDTNDRKIIAAAARGDIYLHQGQYQKAVDQFTQAIDASANLPIEFRAPNAAQKAILQCKLAFCLGMIGKIEESNQLFDTALDDLTKDRPDETYFGSILKPRIALGKAIILKKAGRLAECLQQIRDGIEACSTVEPAREAKGLLIRLLKLGLSITDISQPPEEKISWQKQYDTAKNNGTTNSIRSLPEIMQENPEQLFTE